MLYEMVTGKLPFVAGSSFALMDRIVAGRYKPPEDYVPDLPAPIARAVRAALAREPADRPPSPEALAALLPASLAPSLATASEPAARTRAGADFTVADTIAAGEPRPVDPEAVTEPRPRDTRADFGDAAARYGVLETPDGQAPITRAGDWPDMDVFVGREAELETLKSEYAAAARGDARLVVVVGEAGVGKTSLARAFGAWAREHGARVLTGRFFDYEGSRPAPFQAFLSMLASHGESADRPPDPSAEERVANLLGGTTTRGDAGVGDENDKWRAFAVLSSEFERLAADRPLVLVFDDLQWAGRLHLELLAYLRRSLGGRTLVVGTARDAAAQRHSGSDLSAWLLGLGSLRSCTVLGVRPFANADVRAWLTTVFGRLRIRPLDVQRLEEATGGNPYYLYEVARHLVSSGGIVRGPDGWECAELDRVELPETIANAVRAKLHGLGERLRSVLEAAAVIGDHFRFETLREATGLDEQELEDLVDFALRQQVLSEEGVSRPDDYRFYSKTIRRVLYDELTARRRRRLHERVVRALEAVYGDRLERVAGALCYHHHAVGEWAAALRWGLRAAEEAIARADIEAAESLLARAKTAAAALRSEGTPPAPEEAMRLDLLAGTMLLRLGQPEEAKAVLRGAAEAAARLGAATVQADALLEYANCFLARGELEEGMATAEEAARVAGAAGDRPRALAARIAAGNVLRRLGRTNDAEERFEAILGVLSERDPAPLQSLVYQNLAWIRTQRGRFAEGQELAQRALDLARAAKDPVAQQQAYSTMAFVADETGDREGAARLHEESLRLSRALSFRRREGIDLANIGETHFRLGRYERALAHFEEALAIFVEIGDRACEGDCRVNLGRTLLATGRGEEAVAMLAAGLALCEATGRREYEAIALHYLGEAHLGRGALDDARRALARSRDIFVELDWHDAWRAELGLARVAVASGDAEAARRHVAAAVAAVERARAALPPTADYARFSREVEEVFRLQERVFVASPGEQAAP
jgi:tetratricopeptide (TPR) repeat protein